MWTEGVIGENISEGVAAAPVSEVIMPGIIAEGVVGAVWAEGVGMTHISEVVSKAVEAEGIVEAVFLEGDAKAVASKGVAMTSGTNKNYLI